MTKDNHQDPHRETERCDCQTFEPEGPANLPEGHKAYPVVNSVDGLGVLLGAGIRVIGDCHNGTVINGMYLYGWCRDDATKWTRAAINASSCAGWALFRKIEESK